MLKWSSVISSAQTPVKSELDGFSQRRDPKRTSVDAVEVLSVRVLPVDVPATSAPAAILVCVVLSGTGLIYHAASIGMDDICIVGRIVDSFDDVWRYVS